MKKTFVKPELTVVHLVTDAPIALPSYNYVDKEEWTPGWV